MGAALVVSVACFVGCDGESKPPAVDAAVEATWWQPKVGEAKNWDIQLAAPIDVSEPRTMYDLDLWSLVPSSTTIDYGDGDPVAVPAGALAGTIAWLHARTPSTIVICHVDTGALDLTLPDARKFPGYDPDPKKIPTNPDDPDNTVPDTVKGNPLPGSVIGWHFGTNTKRWLDVREASRAKWIDIMFKRFDLARSIGCDGVEPDHNQVYNFPSGFSPIALESISWYIEVARQGHARMLSTGMRNGDMVPDQLDMGAPQFDWLMLDRCGEQMICDEARPFINAQKAVLAIDYNINGETGDTQGATVVCDQQEAAMIVDGIYKDLALTSKVRTPCVSDPAPGT
jgi:Glycoside-hydrolase family GH114